MRVRNVQVLRSADGAGGSFERGSHIPLIMAALKELFRQRGLQAKEVAASVGVTERTLARWMAGSGVTLRALEDLSRVAGLTVLDLLDIVHEGRGPLVSSLSVLQEQELVDNPPCWFLMAHLLHGIPLSEAQEQFDLPEHQMVLALVRLEKMGLITLLPGNRVRLRVSRNLTWRKNGPIARARGDFFRVLLKEVDFTDGKYVAEMNVVRLSPASLAIVEAKMRALLNEILQLSQTDRQLSAASACDRYVLMMAAHMVNAPPQEFFGLGSWGRATTPSTGN
jgi:transcriptional regulator with XRE-family HTH domain